MSAGFLQFVLAALVIELTPGPNMAWLALLAARHGRIHGLWAVAGIATGLAILALAASAGMAELLARTPRLAGLIRWMGVAFLVYLAAESWFGLEKNDRAQVGERARSGFLRGLVINVLNPKAALVFVTLVPNAIPPGSPAPGTAIAFAGAYVGIATVVHCAIVALAGGLASVLQHPRHEQSARRVSAVLLLAVALWFAAPSFFRYGADAGGPPQDQSGAEEPSASSASRAPESRQPAPDP